MQRQRWGEAPWHLRHPLHSHYRRYERLKDLHQMTEAWIVEVQTHRPAHALPRGLSNEIAKDLWMLNTPSDNTLDSLIDDSTPDEVLLRLERTIIAVQAYTLNELIDRSKQPEDRAILDSVLEQRSWKLGKDSAEKKWASITKESSEDVGKMMLAFQESSWFGPTAFLNQRMTRAESSHELLGCPHRSSFNEVQGVVNELCDAYSHWARGFAYGLNPQIKVDTQRDISNPKKVRCTQYWTLVKNDQKTHSS